VLIRHQSIDIEPTRRDDSHRHKHESILPGLYIIFYAVIERRAPAYGGRMLSDAMVRCRHYRTL